MEELEKLENSMLEAEREINATRLDERYDRLIQVCKLAKAAYRKYGVLVRDCSCSRFHFF